MPLERPSYLPAQLHAAPLRYLWDDTRASKDFPVGDQEVVTLSAGATVRARMALCVALYEWIVWRFEGLHDDPAPLLVAEAAWVATVDPDRFAFFEFTREAWMGPIRGPLWCATTWLRPAIAEGDVHPEELVDGLQYLTRLALHVLPQPELFQRWLRSILDRLVTQCPDTPADPFEDLFDRHRARRRGPIVGRALFDPARRVTPDLGAGALEVLIASADRGVNPFLAA